MVSAASSFAVSTSFSSTTSSGMTADDGAREVARIKAELQSARSEKQCATCEEDEEKLDQQIRQLEAELRRVEAARTAARSKATDNPQTRAADQNSADTDEARDAWWKEPVSRSWKDPDPDARGHLLDITV